jgi:hypothetical protein
MAQVASPSIFGIETIIKIEKITPEKCEIVKF